MIMITYNETTGKRIIVYRYLILIRQFVIFKKKNQICANAAMVIPKMIYCGNCFVLSLEFH